MRADLKRLAIEPSAAARELDVHQWVALYGAAGLSARRRGGRVRD